MQMKAAIYKKYGEAAILNLVLNAMPKVTHSLLRQLCHTSITIMTIVMYLYEYFYTQAVIRFRY